MITPAHLSMFDKSLHPSKPTTPEDVEKTMWGIGLAETLVNMPKHGFWFSEFRVAHGREPQVPNWWGLARSIIRKAGYRPTGIVRPCPKTIPDRKGGSDRYWERSVKSIRKKVV